MAFNILFRKIIFAFSLSIFFFACSPRIYQPKPLEPVLLTQKNQLKINAISDINLTAISAAHSPQENLGIQLGIGANRYKSFSSDNTGRETVYLNEYYFNPYAGLGYYKNIRPDILFEAYSGIGMYNYKNTAISYLKKMNNLNLFLQPSIGYLNKNFDAVLTLRIDYLNRNKTIISDSVLSADNQKKYKFLEYKNYFFFQPGITFKAGLKYVKLQFQISKSIPFNSNYRSIYGNDYRFSLFDPIGDRNKFVYGFGISVELKDVF